MSVNCSAASLATVDGAGTWGPKPTTVGVQSYPLSAIIGAVTNTVSKNSDANLCCEGGRWVHIIVKIPVGANMASEEFRGKVGILGYFE